MCSQVLKLRGGGDDERIFRFGNPYPPPMEQQEEQQSQQPESQQPEQQIKFEVEVREMRVTRYIVVAYDRAEAEEKALYGDGQLVTGELGSPRQFVESVTELGPA